MRDIVFQVMGYGCGGLVGNAGPRTLSLPILARLRTRLYGLHRNVWLHIVIYIILVPLSSFVCSFCFLMHDSSSQPRWVTALSAMIDSSIQSSVTQVRIQPPTITITEATVDEDDSEDVSVGGEQSSIDVDGELLALIEDSPETSGSTSATLATPSVRQAAKKEGKAPGKVPSKSTAKSTPNVCLHFCLRGCLPSMGPETK